MIDLTDFGGPWTFTWVQPWGYLPLVVLSKISQYVSVGLYCPTLYIGFVMLVERGSKIFVTKMSWAQYVLHLNKLYFKTSVH